MRVIAINVPIKFLDATVIGVAMAANNSVSNQPTPSYPYEINEQIKNEKTVEAIIEKEMMNKEAIESIVIRSSSNVV